MDDLPTAVQTILVPVKRSRVAEAALTPALALARRLDAKLVIVSVVEPLPGPRAAPELASTWGEVDALSTVREVSEAIRAQGVRAHGTALVGASPAEAILAAAGEVDADLVVMATHGRTGVARLVAGSVAEGVMRHSAVPVLLVRPRFGAQDERTGTRTNRGPLCELHGGTDAGPWHLLVALDGSRAAEASLPQAAALARALGASLGLVRVVPGSPGVPETEREPVGAVREAERYLRRVAIQLQAAGMEPDAVQFGVRRGSVAQALLDEAASRGACMLVLATHARSGLARVVRGSVAAAVVARATLPVLLVRIANAAAQTPAA